jgi:2-oxo-3-hexenedioate decarboxylase
MLKEIERFPSSEKVRAGEIVTTGTLTEAMPLAPGQTWSARFDGIDLEPLRVHFR